MVTAIAGELTDFEPEGGSGFFWSWTVACGKLGLDEELEGGTATFAVSFLLMADMGAGAIAGPLLEVGGLGAIGAAGAEGG